MRSNAKRNVQKDQEGQEDGRDETSGHAAQRL